MFPGGSSYAAINVQSYWRLGENDPGAAVGVTATNTTDSVGTMNLQFYGNASYANDVAPTAVTHAGSSLSVNFTNSAYATNAIISTATDNFGIECWVKPTIPGMNEIIAYNGITGGAGSGGWGLIIAANNTYQALFGGVTLFGTNLATANVWAHLALVRASGISTLYINGIASATNSNVPGVPSGNFALGAPPQSPTNQFFTGLMDEVRVFTFSPGQFSTNDLLLNHAISPVVTTTGPTFLGGTFATLNGTVNPNGPPATAWFQWGPIQFPYRYTTAVTNLGSGESTLAISQQLKGLTPGVTYHYRLVVSNAFGVVRGRDSHFWAPLLTVNGNNPLILKQQTWVDPGATAHAFPSEVACGNIFSLALKANGTIVTWGDKSDGETNIPAIATNVVAIAAGAGAYDYSLALNANGTVAGWGNNAYGQTNIPAGATNVVAIVAGEAYGLALKADGTVIGWGNNSHGQTNVSSAATNVVAIAAGQYHGLALRADGTVVGWGDDSQGEINIPIGLTNVVAIAAGAGDSLALKADGSVVGWGDNSEGELNVATNADVIAIAAGPYFSVVLKADGTVVGGGYIDPFGPFNMPASATNVIAIAAGEQNVLALNADGTVVGWGDNLYGKINIPSGLDIVNVPILSDSNVNTSKPGSYQVLYYATNADGIVTTIDASVTRTVLVIDSPTISNPSASVVGTNAVNGLRTVRFSASINPNGSPTMVSIDYGLTAGYGAVSSTNILPGLFTPQTTTFDVPLSADFAFHWSVFATNGMDSIPGSVFTPDQLFVVPAAFPLGDANGDGIVDQSELNAVYSNYLPNSPWLLMTNIAGLGQTNVSFALSNSPLGAYSVEVSTNLTDWQLLGPATPRYLFTDTNAPAAPQRYYRLHYP
ncbi:MAG TPA: LamG-like jellyroll fold domain-containing protein [Verrucomicrobiae bacterium]|nr:LamG-like jellyroll fold domain-containing protein [Verrucomicrobiae bacterium]